MVHTNGYGEHPSGLLLLIGQVRGFQSPQIYYSDEYYRLVQVAVLDVFSLSHGPSLDSGRDRSAR